MIFLGLVLARPLTVTYQLWQARAAVGQHEPQQAAGWLEAAYRLSPQRGEIQLWQARVCRRLDAYDAMQKHLARAGELGLPGERIDRERLLALVQSGRLPPELPEASALLVEPGADSLEIYQAFTRAYIDAFQIGPALRLLDGWQADFPQDAQPYYYRGMVCVFQQDWPGAEKAFREALRRSTSARRPSATRPRASRAVPVSFRGSALPSLPGRAGGCGNVVRSGAVGF